MNARTVSSACVAVTLLCSGLSAQKPPKPPSLSTGIEIGRTLALTIEYEAVPWSAGQAPGKVGSLKTKRSIRLAGRDVDKGTLSIAISKIDPDLWQLELLPKKKSDPVLTWALGAPVDAAPETAAGPLQIACEVDASSAASLHVSYGGIQARFPLAATETVEAALEADPAIRSIDAQIQRAGLGGDPASWRTRVPKPTAVEFDPERTYLWHLLTNRGPITLRFFPDTAPMHVTSTIYLTRAGFYDGLGFHRVVTGFMAQGGCALGTGSGSCGYTYGGEVDTPRRHDRPGILSMANSGPDTDNSQFFITFAAAPHLDGKHAIFGEVVDGMDVVKRLEAVGSDDGATSAKLTIDAATVTIR